VHVKFDTDAAATRTVAALLEHVGGAAARAA
jgi:hypothetical protein